MRKYLAVLALLSLFVVPTVALGMDSYGYDSYSYGTPSVSYAPVSYYVQPPSWAVMPTTSYYVDPFSDYYY